MPNKSSIANRVAALVKQRAGRPVPQSFTSGGASSTPPKAGSPVPASWLTAKISERTKDDDVRLNAPLPDLRPFTGQFGGKRPTLTNYNEAALKLKSTAAKAVNFMASYTNPETFTDEEVTERINVYKNALEPGKKTPDGNSFPHRQGPKAQPQLLSEVKWLGLQYPSMPEFEDDVDKVALFTPDGTPIPVATDSSLWKDRARLELSLENDVKLKRISQFEKSLKLLAYDVTSMGYIDNFGNAQRIAEVINDVDSSYQVLGALYRGGQYLVEFGWLGLNAKVLASSADAPKPPMFVSHQEKIDWLMKYDVPLQKQKLEQAQKDLEQSEGTLALMWNLARVMYYTKKVDDPLDYERALRGMDAGMKYYLESQEDGLSPEERTRLRYDYTFREQLALKSEEIRITQKEEAQERLAQLTDEIAIVQTEIENIYNTATPDNEVSTEMAERRWETAIELMIEKQYLRDSISDTFAYSGAYTWNAEPERYAAYQRNRALFELQVGRPPTIAEERRIKQLNVNMAAEFWGEAIFDVTNLAEMIPGGMALAFPTAASKIKFATKLAGESVTNVLTKADNVLKSTKGVNAIYEIGKTATYPVRWLFTQTAASTANRTKNTIFNIFSNSAKSFTSVEDFSKMLSQVGQAATLAIGKGLRETVSIYDNLIKNVPGTRNITFDQFTSLIDVADVTKHGIASGEWATMYLRAVDDFIPQMEEDIRNRILRAAKLSSTDTIPDELRFQIVDTINKAKTPGGMEIAIGKFSENFERTHLDAFRVTNANIWGRGSDIMSDTLWGRMVLGLRATAGDLDTRAVRDILSYVENESIDLGKSINKALLEFSIALGKRADGSRSNASAVAGLLADTLEVVNRVLNTVRTAWIVMVLTLNPRYYLGNYIDNMMRTIPYGGNPLDDVMNLGTTFKSIKASIFGGPEPETEAATKLKQLGGTIPAEVGQALARPDLDATASVANRILYEGWNPRFGLGSYIADEWTRLRNAQPGFTNIPESISNLFGEGPLVRSISNVLESTSLAWKSLINGATDFNASIEFAFRLRTFHREYFKELAKSEAIFKQEAMKGLNKNLLKTAEAMFDGALSPEELLSKVKDMIDPTTNSFKQWSSLLPPDAFDALRGMTPGERASFLATFRENADEYFKLLQLAGKDVDAEAIDTFFNAVEKSFFDIHDVYMQAAARERALIDTINSAVPDEIHVPDDILEGVEGAAVRPPTPPARPAPAEKVKPIKYNRMVDNLETDKLTIEKVDGEGFEIVSSGDSIIVRIGSGASNETLRKGLLNLYAVENEDVIRSITGLNVERFVDEFDAFIRNPMKYSEDTANKGQIQNFLLMFDSAEMEKYRYAMKGSGVKVHYEQVEVLMKKMDLKIFDKSHPDYSRYGYVPSHARRIAGNSAAIQQVNLKMASKRLEGKSAALMQKFDSGVDTQLQASLSAFYRDVWPGPKVAEYNRSSKWKLYDKLMENLYNNDASLRRRAYDLTMGTIAGRSDSKADLDAFLENFNQDYITNWLLAHGIEDIRWEDGRIVSVSITSFDLASNTAIVRKFNSSDSGVPAALQRQMYSNYNKQAVETPLSFKISNLKEENLENISSNLIISFGMTRSSANEYAKVIHNYAEMIADMTGKDTTFRDILARLGFKRLDYSVDIEDIYKMQNVSEVDMFTLVGNGTRNVESLTEQLGNLFYRDMIRLWDGGDAEARKLATKNLMDIHAAVSKITGKPVDGRLSPEEMGIFRQIFVNYIHAGETGNREFAPVFKSLRRFLNDQYKGVDVNKAIPKEGAWNEMPIGAAGAPSTVKPTQFASDVVDDETYAVMDRMFMGHKLDSFDEDGARIRMLRTIAKNNGIEFKTDRQLLNYINRHSSVVGVDEVTKASFINSMVNAGRPLEEAEVAFELMQVRAKVWSERLNQPIDKMFDTLFIQRLDDAPKVALKQEVSGNPKEIVASELESFIRMANSNGYSNSQLDKFWGEFSRATFQKNVWTDPAFAKVINAVWLDEDSGELPRAINNLFDALERDGLTQDFFKFFADYHLTPMSDAVVKARSMITATDPYTVGFGSFDELAQSIQDIQKNKDSIASMLEPAPAGNWYDEVFDGLEETPSGWLRKAVDDEAHDMHDYMRRVAPSIERTYGKRREDMLNALMDIAKLESKGTLSDDERLLSLIMQKNLLDQADLVDGKLTNPHLIGTVEHAQWESKTRVANNVSNAITKTALDIDLSDVSPMERTVLSDALIRHMSSLKGAEARKFRASLRINVAKSDIREIMTTVREFINTVGSPVIPNLGDRMISPKFLEYFSGVGDQSVLPADVMKAAIDDLVEFNKVRLGGELPALKSPSGQSPKLFERVDLTDLPTFKAWFKDSKVVDPNTGRPLIMYHGSSFIDYTVPDTSKISKNNLYGPGFYFSESKTVTGQGYVEKGARQIEYSYKGTYADAEKYLDEFIDSVREENKMFREIGAPHSSDSELEDFVNDLEDAMTLYSMESPEMFKESMELRMRANYATPIDRFVYYLGDKGLFDKTTPDRPGVLPVYLSIQNPFDVDAMYTRQLMESETWFPDDLLDKIFPKIPVGFSLDYDELLPMASDFVTITGDSKTAYPKWSELEILTNWLTDLKNREVDISSVMYEALESNITSSTDQPLEALAKRFAEYLDALGAFSYARPSQISGENLLDWIQDIPAFNVADMNDANMWLRTKGFDGITHIGGGRWGGGDEMHRVYIAFEPTQIKSVYNGGTFDPTNPDIMKQQMGKVTKGAYWTKFEDRFIALGENADVSTFFHEFWHDYLHELRTFAGNEDVAFDWARGDLDVLTKAAGLKDGAEFNKLRVDFETHRALQEMVEMARENPKSVPMTVEELTTNIRKYAAKAKKYEEAEEIIVRTGLAYFKSGKAPVSELEKAFERLKEWFTKIWEDIKSSTFRITPQVRAAYDRAFTGSGVPVITKTRYSSLKEVPLSKVREIAKMTADDRAMKELKAAFEVWSLRRGPIQGIDPEIAGDYDKLTAFLVDRIQNSEGPMVDEYRRILFQLEHLTDEIGAMFEAGYKKMGIPMPKDDMVGSEMKSILRKSEDNIRILESIRRFLPQMRRHMHKVIDSGTFLPGLTKFEIDELLAWAEKASTIKAQMNDVLTNGGTALNAAGENLFTSTGALKKTNDIMIDYSKRTHFDSIMRSVFPFWMFPSRSMPFWLKTVGTHPAILAMYMKLQRASETAAYQQGAVDRNGRTYKSLKGYLPIGTTGLWINPVQQLSAKYVLDALYYGDYLLERNSFGSTYEETSPGAAVLTDMIESGPLLGLFPAPWMKVVLGTFMNVPADTFPSFPIGPQVSLVPRWKYEIFFNQGQVRKSVFDNVIYPEVSWKESQIEKYLLEKYQSEVDSGLIQDTQLERNKVWDAIRNKGTHPTWIAAKQEYENNEAETSRLSFFTGAYLKSYSDGKADFVKQKNQIELLSWGLNSPPLAATLGMPTDPSARDDLLNAERFETPDAWLYQLYNMTNWVRNAQGQTIDEPKERARILAENMDEQARTSAAFAQLKQLQKERDAALSTMPVGSYNTPEWNAIWTTYNEGANAIYNTLPDRTYYGVNATNQKIEERIRAEWWRRLTATMPVWDVKNEEYEDYEKKLAQWKSSLPAIARTLAGSISEDYPDGSGTFQYYLDSIRKNLRKGQTVDDALIEALVSESTASGYELHRRSNDDLLTAMNEVYRIEYEKPYYSALDGLGGFTRRYAEDEWNKNNPEPDAAKLFKWLQHYYPGRFTLAQVKAQLEGIQERDKVFSISERSDAKKSDYELQKQDIWEVLAAAGLSKQKAYLFTNEFTDARTGLPNAEDYITTWYLSNGQAWDKQDPEAQKAFEAFHDAVMKLAKEQQIGKLTPSQVATLARAESLNVKFNQQVEQELGKQFLSNFEQRRVGVLGAYLSMDRDDRKAFRQMSPELYALIPEYYRLRDEFARENPLWAQFYYKYSPEGDVTRGGTISGTSGGYYRPSKKPGKGGGGGYSPSQPQQIQWPSGFTNFISLTIMQEIVAFLNSGQALSNATVTYLQTLAVNHPEWNAFISELID